MRVSLATGTLVASTLLTLVGCSNPFWNPFNSKSKSATPSKTALTNAPAPPSFGAQAAVTPAVTMPPAASQASNTSSSFPVYPGTNYQVTPYAMPPLASGVAANTPAYPANAPAAATPQGAPGGTSNPPSVANNPNTQPVNPLAAGGQYPPSTAPQYPPSTAPQYPPFNGPSPPAGPYNAVNPAAAVNR